MTTSREYPRLRKLGKSYQNIAVLFLNTVIGFVLMNLIAYPFVLILDRSEAVGALNHGMDKLRQVYPGLTDSEIEQLLVETWGRQYIYEPFTQFKEGIIEGEYVNTDPAGFRLIKEQAVWPPVDGAFNIFVFGGSTTFGYGIPDNDTIPSHLQDALRSRGNCAQTPNVYNFGRANYYSTQERIFFEQLLANDIRPDMVIFIDGLNDFYHLEDEPKFTAQLSYLLNESDNRLVGRAIKTLPILALLSAMRSAVTETAATAQPSIPEEKLELVIDRYLMNKRLIENLAAEFEVQSFFVWQPAPTYQYNTENDVFYGGEVGYFGEHTVSGEGYSLMAQKIENGEISLDESSFLWLADLQVGRSDPLYVDRVHYTGEFSRDIAVAVAEVVGNYCD